MAVPTQGKMAARSLSCCSAATGCRNRSTWTTNCESCTRYPCMFRPINRKTTGWNHRGSVTIYYGRISYHMPKFTVRTSILRFSVLSQVPGHDELLADRSWRQANIWRTEENPGGNGEKQQGILISTQCVGMFLLVGQWQGGQSWAGSGFERDCTGQLQLVDHIYLVSFL